MDAIVYQGGTFKEDEVSQEERRTFREIRWYEVRNAKEAEGTGESKERT